MTAISPKATPLNYFGAFLSLLGLALAAVWFPEPMSPKDIVPFVLCGIGVLINLRRVR